MVQNIALYLVLCEHKIKYFYRACCAAVLAVETLILRFLGV